VAPLSPRPGHGVLRCPICRLDLTAAAGALACANRHSFDLAREGYVNLIRGARRRPSAGGDSSQQLRHRESFLRDGHFDAIAATIVTCVHGSGVKPTTGCWRVVDAGSGTGYHLGAITAMVRAPVLGLGLDIAREAARRGARRWPEHAFAVADLWKEWPVKDAAADLVISIFAPKNFPETARVLGSRGWFVLVYPGPNHLVELQDRFALMRQHEGKHRHYVDAVRRYIGAPTISRLTRHAVLEGEGIRNALLMGPNARHISPSALDTAIGPLTVTFDLFVLVARKPGAKGSGRLARPAHGRRDR